MNEVPVGLETLLTRRNYSLIALKKYGKLTIKKEYKLKGFNSHLVATRNYHTGSQFCAIKLKMHSLKRGIC